MFEVIAFEVYLRPSKAHGRRSVDRDTDKLSDHLSKEDEIVVLEKRSRFLQKSCNRQTLRQNVVMFHRRGK
jgi:hypothetical protein